MGQLRYGVQSLIWGTVAQDAKFREFESGKTVTNFSVRYDSVAGEEKGRRKGIFMDVSAWNELSHYAAGLEKNDMVLVAGTLQKDKYKSEKKGSDQYVLVADLVLVQPLAEYEEAENNADAEPPEQTFTELSDQDGELPF